MQILSNLLPQAAPPASAASASTPAADLPALPASPDLIELTSDQVQEVIDRLRKVKWGQLYRDYRAWEALSCELVWVPAPGQPDDSDVGMFEYQQRASCTSEPPFVPKLVSSVELTPAELDAGLRAKQEQVYGDLQFRHRLAEAEARQAAHVANAPILTSRLVAAQAFDRACHLTPAPSATWLGPTYRLDEDSEPVFWLLAHYFAGDARFLTLAKALGVPNPSFEKGLAILGNVGVGKTLMLRAYQQNPVRPYGLVSARFVAASYKGAGDPSKQALFEGAARKALAIDDIGTEEGRVLSYGNATGPFAEVLQARYDRAQGGHLPRWATHLSSNYALEPTDETKEFGLPTIHSLYGERVVSRIYELCNIISLNGPDRRA